MAWPKTTTAILFFLCTLGSGTAMAQDPGRSGLCFRPNLDEQRCGASLATETMYVLHGGEGGPEPELGWKLGLMVNLGDRRAVGGALTLIGLHDEFYHNGVELRYRHGVGETGALEGALGGDWRWPTRSFSGKQHFRTRVGLGLWATPSFGMLVGAAAGAGDRTLSGGFQLGSWPGLLAGVAYTLLAVGLAL